MFSTSNSLLLALTVSAVTATNFSAWTDKSCGRDEWPSTLAPAYVLPGLEPYLNSSCFQLPAGLNSLSTNFGDFIQADLVGYFFLDANCGALGVAIENTGASPEFPVQDGQCVQAPPFKSPLTNATWGSLSLSTFR